MSQSKSPPRKAKRVYPLVKVGMRVNWYIDGSRNSPPLPGVVMNVGEKALDIAVLHPDYDRLDHKHGVRHVDEKDVTTMARDESGGWEHAEDLLWFFGEFPEYGTWPDEEEEKVKKPKEPKGPDNPQDPPKP